MLAHNIPTYRTHPDIFNKCIYVNIKHYFVMHAKMKPHTVVCRSSGALCVCVFFLLPVTLSLLFA